jgi:hypothetical protein
MGGAPFDSASALQAAYRELSSMVLSRRPNVLRGDGGAEPQPRAVHVRPRLARKGDPEESVAMTAYELKRIWRKWRAAGKV